MFIPVFPVENARNEHGNDGVAAGIEKCAAWIKEFHNHEQDGKAASGRLKTETIMVSPAAPPPGTLLVATEEVTPTKMARRKAKPSRGTPNIVVASTSA